MTIFNWRVPYSTAFNINTREGIEAWVKALGPLSRKLMNQFYPRRYTAPTGYTSIDWLRLHSVMTFETLTDRTAHNMMDDTTSAVLRALMKEQLRIGSPVYWADPNWLVAVWLTNPPRDTEIKDLEVPLPSFLIMLPTSFTMRHFGWHLPFIQMGKIQIGKDFKFDKPEKYHDTHLLLLSYALMLSNGLAYDYAFWTRNEVQLSELDNITQEHLDTEESFQEIIEKIPSLNTETPGEKAEADLLKTMPLLAIKILMVLNAEPHHRTEAKLERPVRIKRGRIVKKELWSPAWIGKGYVTEKHYGKGGKHASPRMHWRRGHMHTVLYGKGRSQRKLLWFKPVLVNLQDTEENHEPNETKGTQ